MNTTGFLNKYWSMLFALIISATTLQGQSYFTYSSTQGSNGDYIYHFQPDMQALLDDYPLESSEGSYTFFWSFGDGQYSFKPSPSHVYSEDDVADVVEARMIATPIYSPVPPPPMFAEMINAIGSTTTPEYPDYMLSLVRDPVPQFSSLAIINYKNVTSETIDNAKLRLYFHDDYFAHLESLTFNNEVEAGIEEDNSSPAKYNAYLELEVGTLLSAEQHTVFVDLEATAAVIGDVGSDFPTLFLRAELFYERVNSIIIVQSDDLLTKGGGSWDPNSKFTKTKLLFQDEAQVNPAAIRYKINFQNIGIAPVNDVTIEDELPVGLNPATLHIEDYYHPSIDVYDNFTFDVDVASGLFQCTFHNINLDGLNQPGGVDPSQTKGSLTFSISADLNLVPTTLNPSPGPFLASIDTCLPYDSLVNTARIIFDGNPPILTNPSSIDLYYSNSMPCGRIIFPEIAESFAVVPNPVTNGIIKIKTCHLLPQIPVNEIEFYVFSTPSMQKINCELNPTIHYPPDACPYISLEPPCLTPGLYVVQLVFPTYVSTFNVVVN